MSEEKILEITDEELDSVAGGASSRGSERTKKVNKSCHRCQILGKDMHEQLYKYKGKMVCFAMGHVYGDSIDAYLGIDPKFALEAKKHL